MRLSSFWEESFLFVPAGVVSSVLLGDSTLDKVHLSSPVQVRIEKTLDQNKQRTERAS